MEIQIIMPVYGESPWLEDAIESVQKQSSDNWELLIADDGLEIGCNRWLENYLSKCSDSRISWVKRKHNLGLFANLNKAIAGTKADWILLLCSDDKLERTAVADLRELVKQWGEVNCILSSFHSIGANGRVRKDDSGFHHSQLSDITGIINTEQMLPALLKLGSLNGNLTGMFFQRKIWEKVGIFKEEWTHAADWEWLIRVCEKTSILLNRKPIASVRTHDQQLSVKNRISGNEIKEVGQVVEILINHELLRQEKHRHAWAGHIMQFQLWNLLKAGLTGQWSQWPVGITSIHKSAGLRQTCLSLIIWLPTRWKRIWIIN